MRNLTLSEFESYCKNKKVERYIFSSGNQTDEMFPIGFSVWFSDVFVSLCPNRIGFISDRENKIFFDDVQRVCIDEGMGGIRCRITIFCCNERDEVVSYVILAR